MHARCAWDVRVPSHWTPRHVDLATKHHYNKAIALMDGLVDAGAMDDAHPLNGLFLLAADLVHQYEQVHHPLPNVTGVQMLRFLMEQHDLRQTDLVNELGSQGVVSEILSGKRELNKNHIAALSKRFSVSPAVYF
jgi:HTH-type transcriptional regulator/antitoxin HigA